MIIDTRAIGFALTEPIARYVEMRIVSALGPFARNVMKVAVQLKDINALRGGIDKRCRIVVAVRRHGVEVTQATHSDLYAAIDEAATQIRRSVSRSIKQCLTRERKDPQRPGTLVTV
jgi:putative sigma-54 modulation protein